MLQYRLYGGHSLPNGLQGVLKASANIGSVVGQFGFGMWAHDRTCQKTRHIHFRVPRLLCRCLRP